MSLSSVQIMTAPSGFTQANVRMAGEFIIFLVHRTLLTTIEDIDGDGRSDYCLVWDNGDVHCYRNAGVGDAPSSWEEMSGSNTYIFPGQNNGDTTGVIFSESIPFLDEGNPFTDYYAQRILMASKWLSCTFLWSLK